MNAEGSIQIFGIPQIDVPNGMMDVGNLVKCEPDVRAGVEGQIVAAEFHGGAEIAVKLEN